MARIVYLILAILQLLGISIGVCVATIEIESIVYSGPIVSLMGIVTATGWFRRRLLSVAALGLSTVAVTVSLFLLIFLNDWSPRAAEEIVPHLLFAYQLGILPVGLMAIHGWLTCGSDPGEPINRQFGVRSMLLLTGSAALVLFTVRVARMVTEEALSLIAVGLAVATVLAIVATFIVVLSANTSRAPQPLDSNRQA